MGLDVRKAIRGQIKKPKQLWQSKEHAFIINGYLYKKDVNLVINFLVNEIPEYNIILGPYPQFEEDVVALKEQGVTAVLCVQSLKDFKHRDIKFEIMQEYYKKYDIEVEHKPINDFDEFDLIDKLEVWIGTLATMLEKDKAKVFVHCTAGMSRSVAVVIGYLCVHHGEYQHLSIYASLF